jgi:glycosyltransferase involved in cell wall biosynthesis
MPTPPRVLILSAYYSPFQGGVETHARNLAAYLARTGFRVSIVTRQVGRESRAFEIIDDIPVHRVRPAGARTGWRKWLMIPFAIARILRLRHDFDLIYCPGYQGIGIAAVVAGKLLKRPVILRSGNLGVLRGTNWDAPLARWRINPDSIPVKWLKRQFRRVYTSADAFVCNCLEIEEEALACEVPRDRVHYLPNAVDLDRFRLPEDGERARVRAEEGWSDDAVLCVFVGRLSVEKGVLDLLDAWRTMPRTRTCLVLVGPDMSAHPLDAGPAARRYVAEHAMDDVVFYGESTHAERLLRAADLYVQPSHYEAFSNALIEAMAAGLPAVASRVGGMLDCIVDNDNGLFCRPADAPDLARQLRRLIEDPALRARLGARARATVVESFDQVTIFRKFADLFAETAARSAD